MNATVPLSAETPLLPIPKRRFRMGRLDLPDQAPEVDPPIKALRTVYADQYPHLKRATLAEPYMEGDTLIYEVQKHPVQTKA